MRPNFNSEFGGQTLILSSVFLFKVRDSCQRPLNWVHTPVALSWGRESQGKGTHHSKIAVEVVQFYTKCRKFRCKNSSWIGDETARVKNFWSWVRSSCLSPDPLATIEPGISFVRSRLTDDNANNSSKIRSLSFLAVETETTFVLWQTMRP